MLRLHTRWLASLVAFAVLAGPSHAQETRTFRVEVNGRVEKLVFLLVGPDGRLAAGRDDLAAWGLLEASGPRVQLEGLPPSVELYWLDELTDVVVDVDETQDVVRLEPAPETLDSRVSAGRRPQLDYDLRRGWGADATYRASVLSRVGASPLFDLRGGLGLSLGEFGRLQATVDAGRRTVASTTTGEGESAAGSSVLLRDVRLRRDFGSGYVFHAGQITANPGGFASGLRLAGFSVGTNSLGRARTTLSSRYTRFEDLVTLTEPGTVEIRVNGRVIADRAVGAGRLSISDIPIDDGDNDIQVLVRHGDGRLEVIERSIAGGIDLIAGGESEIGAAGGALAIGDLLESERYSDAFGSLFYARGLSENHTLRWSAEGRSGDERHIATQLEFSSRLPGGLLAKAGASLSASRTPDGSVQPLPGDGATSTTRPSFVDAAQGWEIEGQVERDFGNLRIAIGGSHASDQYLTLRQSGFALESRWRGRVDWLYRSRGLGTIGLRYRYQEEWGIKGSHSVFATAQRRLGSGSLRLRGGYDGRPGTGGLNGSVGLSIGLGRRGSRAFVNVRGDGLGTQSSVSISKSLSTNTRGVAWSARADRRSLRSAGGRSTLGGDATLTVRSSAFEARASARVADGVWSGNGQVAGSLVFIGRRLFATSPVGPSYVLVDAGEADGVSVLQDRRNVGVIGRRGALLMPFVSSLSTSQIELDPRSLQPGLVGDVLRERVTFAPGASIVSFAVRRTLQAILTLVDDAGDPWPAGTEIRATDGAVLGFVGKLGLTHVTDLIIGDVLQVVADERTCTLRLELEPASTGVVRLGSLRCDG